ncbi:hypothetical protein D3C84_414280 [compost metagenome]
MKIDLLGEGAIVIDDGVEDFLRVVHQVHLVDGQDHLANADQRSQIAVTPGLGQHAASGVDHHHGHVGRGGTGHHVAGVLLMAWGIGNDKLAQFRGEKTVGHVDGNALFALGGQAVHQQREVQFATLGAVFFRVGLQRFHLVFEEHFRIVEQASDQRALAIVHAATGNEAQQALVLVGLQVLPDILGNQVRYVCH